MPTGENILQVTAKETGDFLNQQFEAVNRFSKDQLLGRLLHRQVNHKYDGTEYVVVITPESNLYIVRKDKLRISQTTIDEYSDRLNEIKARKEKMNKEWNRGFQDGQDFAIKYFVNGFYIKDWPKNWHLGWYGGGFAEGQICGRNKCFKRDFPDMISFSATAKGEAIVEFKDGSKKIITK